MAMPASHQHSQKPKSLSRRARGHPDVVADGRDLNDAAAQGGGAGRECSAIGHSHRLSLELNLGGGRQSFEDQPAALLA